MKMKINVVLMQRGVLHQILKQKKKAKETLVTFQ